MKLSELLEKVKDADPEVYDVWVADEFDRVGEAKDVEVDDKFKTIVITSI